MKDFTKIIEQRLDTIDPQGELSFLTTQCITLLTANKARQKELEEQGHIQRFFKTISGKNDNLSRAISGDLTQAQLVAQQTLNILHKRQALSLNLICALNQKVNTIQLQNEKHFIQLQQLIAHSYDRIEQLEQKTNRIDSSVYVLQWERLANYEHLTLPQLLITLVKDFFRQTGGTFTQPDLLIAKLLLEKYVALDTQISYKEISQEAILLKELFTLVPLLPNKDLVYLSAPVQQLYLQQKTTNTKSFSIRDMMHELLHTLVLIKYLTRPVHYQVILAPLQEPKERIHIIRTLCLDAGLEQVSSKELTWTTSPAVVKTYETMHEAATLKKALEKHKCLVHIEETDIINSSQP